MRVKLCLRCGYWVGCLVWLFVGVQYCNMVPVVPQVPPAQVGSREGWHPVCCMDTRHRALHCAGVAVRVCTESACMQVVGKAVTANGVTCANTQLRTVAVWDVFWLCRFVYRCVHTSSSSALPALLAVVLVCWITTRNACRAAWLLLHCCVSGVRGRQIIAHGPAVAAAY